MISFFKKLWRDKRGNALVIAAASMPLVLGSAGLASDTIQWTMWKRQLQRAADSAAVAGVYAKIQDNSVNDAVTRDLTSNSHVGITTTVATTNPPVVGGYTADEHAVRVALSVQKKLSFSGMFMNFVPTISATSTATIVPSGNYCVISLEEEAVTGIDATGSTNVNLGCGMMTNSVSMTAAVATGSSSVTATPIAAVGGIPASTHWGTGTKLEPFTPWIEDPFKDVPVPSPSSCSAFPNNQPSDTMSIANPTGTMCFNTEMNIKGKITLAPGTYILNKAGLKMSNTGAELNCTGCTIILTSDVADTDPGSIGQVDMEGGKLNLTSPTSGTYKGIILYQDRRAAANNSVKINGNNASYMEGALYFPRADLTFNGTSGQNTNCLQIVTKRVTFTGNSAVNNTCPTGSGAKSFAGRKVRLVE